MSKPATNRLGGLIQPKGNAPRPAEAPQRGELAPTPTAEPAQPVAADQKEPVKSLTVKLTLRKYRRLRSYASQTDLTHQQIIEEAIDAYLAGKGFPE